MVQPPPVMRRSLNNGIGIHLCGGRGERGHMAQALSLWIRSSHLSHATKMRQPGRHRPHSRSCVPSVNETHWRAFLLCAGGARTKESWHLLHRKRKSTGGYIHKGAGCSKIRKAAWKIEHLWATRIELSTLGTHCISFLFCVYLFSLRTCLEGRVVFILSTTQMRVAKPYWVAETHSLPFSKCLLLFVC